MTVGSVSALYYGQVISNDIVNAVIITSIGTVLLTTLSKNVASRTDTREIRLELQRVMCTMMMIAGLLSVLYYVEGIDLVKIFFERGSFTSENTIMVSSVAVFYSLGFVFMANREILIKAHYAFQDTMIPMINSAIGVMVNLIGNILLAKVMGVCGIALATTISMVLVSVISFFTIKRHIGMLPLDKRCFYDILKILFSIVASAGTGKILYSMMLDCNALLRMIVVGVSICIVNVGLNILLKESVMHDTILPKFIQIIKKG